MVSKSEHQYQREGDRLLKRARRLFPDLSPVEALIAEAKSSATIRASTLRRYRPSYRKALSAAGSRNIEVDFERLCAALEYRRGKPAKSQTATKKVTDCSYAEAAATFRQLKRLVLERGGESAMVAGLYVLVAPRIGLRPIELLDCVVEGHKLKLKLKTAKSRTSRLRELSLKRYSETFIEALRWLCVFAQSALERSAGRNVEQDFENWRNRAAETLARASLSATGRRLSLYSFRHVALATWKASGFSAAEIAEMAGHLSHKSAGHYASGKHGWKEEDVLVMPHRALPAEDAAPSASCFPASAHRKEDEDRPIPVTRGEDTGRDETSRPETSPPASKAAFVFEDFPMPPPRPVAAPSGIDGRAVFEAKADEIEALVNRFSKGKRGRSGPQGNDDPANKR